MSNKEIGPTLKRITLDFLSALGEVVDEDQLEEVVDRHLDKAFNLGIDYGVYACIRTKIEPETSNE